jgi:hypothetical protein
MKKNIDYLETFTFPDIPWQSYPVYSVSESGHVFNLKSILYPNSTSVKKYTRKKQLSKRSQQAKMFDFLINVGYWEPLMVVPEFPIIIQNSIRLKGQEGSFMLLDYYFPQLSLCVELDSDLHSKDKDAIRDKYLQQLGIRVFRIEHLEKPEQQKKRFRELITYIRNITIPPSMRVFSFIDNIKKYKNL